MPKAGNWANQIRWSAEMDATLIRMRDARHTFEAIALRLGVSDTTVIRRFWTLFPDLRNGKGGMPVPPPLVFVSASQFRGFHGSNDIHGALPRGANLQPDIAKVQRG